MSARTCLFECLCPSLYIQYVSVCLSPVQRLSMFVSLLRCRCLLAAFCAYSFASALYAVLTYMFLTSYNGCTFYQCPFLSVYISISAHSYFFCVSLLSFATNSTFSCLCHCPLCCSYCILSLCLVSVSDRYCRFVSCLCLLPLPLSVS